MKRKNINNILKLVLFLSFCFVPKLTMAACDWTKWGVNTGSSSSLGGLVVTTTNNGVVSNMGIKIGTNNNNYDGVSKVTSSYTQGAGYSELSWNTGSTYYSATQSSPCNNDGYLVLGYGSSNHQGNTYALDCKADSGNPNVFYAQMIWGNPTSYGYWSYSTSGLATVDAAYHVNNSADNANPIVYFQVMNGYTGWITFNWVPQTPPSPPNLGVSLTATPNSGTAPLNNVALTATVSGTATGDVVYNFDCTNDGTNDVTQTNNNTTNACDYTNAGTFTARVTVTRGGLTATNTATITVQGAPELTCNVTPQGGLAPLVVRVDAILTNLTGGTYDYDMENAAGYEYTNRPNRVYYTYPNPGTYNVTVRHNPSGLTAPCTPNSITVTNPDEGNGGEVAP